jgi:5'-AMP-activated protein kinase, catalytic alpha subunit
VAIKILEKDKIHD